MGTMTFGTPVAEADAIRMVHWALDHGINFIDSANIYEGYARVLGSPGGVAESIIGKALKGRRDQAVLATKVGMRVGEAPEDEGTSPAALRKHLELSLDRLATDVIDLYYLHKPDPETPLVETLGALDQVIREGKVRYYGVSNYSARELSDLLTVADADGLPRPVLCQPPLSLLRQDVLSDLLPLCEREHIAVTPYQILQSGLLTGKYRRGESLPEDSRKGEQSGWVWELTDALFDRLDEIEAQSRKAGLTMTQHAIRWVLAQPAVVAAIVGVKRTEQLEEAMAAVVGG
ncbi:MAG: aldo/keto reductase [Candidatus Latescibacteria bacterium]|nr:aldo/keto reductase [Candidatus Latescibacterota bacterium]